MSSIAISNKGGFGLRGGFWNRFGVVFIKAPIETVSLALSDLFEAKCDCNLSLKAVAKIDRETSRSSNKRFLFQYLGHDWTVWWAFATEEIAFTLSCLLETKSFVLTYSGTSDWTEVKIFECDCFIEHYIFGFDDLEPEIKIGKDAMGYDAFFIETVQNIYYPNLRIPLPPSYRHIFCSSIRDLSEKEVNDILASSSDEFGLLNDICKFHNLYFPDCSEILLYCDHSEEYLSLDFNIKRIDCVELPESAYYWDNKLSVPKKVANFMYR